MLYILDLRHLQKVGETERAEPEGKKGARTACGRETTVLWELLGKPFFSVSFPTKTQPQPLTSPLSIYFPLSLFFAVLMVSLNEMKN